MPTHSMLRQQPRVALSIAYKHSMRQVLDRGPVHHHPGSILPPGGGSEGWRDGQAIKGGGVDVAIGSVVDMAVGGVDLVVDVAVELVAVGLGPNRFIKFASTSDNISLKSAQLSLQISIPSDDLVVVVVVVGRHIRGGVDVEVSRVVGSR